MARKKAVRPAASDKAESKAKPAKSTPVGKALSPTAATKRGTKKAEVFSSGRWTDEEHAKFLEGLEKFGRAWTKVAEHVGTRSVMQIRTHAQKWDEKEVVVKPKATPAKGTKKTRAEKESSEPAEENPTPTKKLKATKTDKKTTPIHVAKLETKPKSTEKPTKVIKATKKAAAPAPISDPAPAPAPAPATPSRPSKAKAKPPPVSAVEAEASPANKPKVASKRPTPIPPTIHPVIQVNSPPPAWIPQGVPEGPFTDKDFLLPTANEAIAARPANREYIQLLQANCALYHSLPAPDQMWFLGNVYHFLTTVRGRRLVHLHPYMGVRVLNPLEPAPFPLIAAELNLDTFKRAAFQFHPFWVLGEHDPTGYHKNAPFVHRKVDGSWKKADLQDVRKILQSEGPKNLLLLPTGMDIDEELKAAAAKNSDSTVPV